MSFHVVTFGNRRLIAIPVTDRPTSHQAIACYPSHTWKKRAMRYWMRFAFRVGIGTRIWRSGDLPLEGVDSTTFSQWIGSLCNRLGHHSLQPVVVWPADHNRGRVYIHLFGPSGDAIAFCKLALDSKNSDLVLRERQSLESFETQTPTNFSAPRVLDAGLLNGLNYLVVTLTPSTARITNWSTDRPISSAIQAISGPVRFVAPGDVSALSWWSQLEAFFESHPAFYRVVMDAAGGGIEVCRVHGDMNQTNVLRDGNDVWIIDWEHSCADGPVMTDEVCVAIDDLVQRYPSDIAGIRCRLNARFAEHASDVTAGRIVLAMAYLVAVNFTPAIAVVRQWFPDYTHPAAKVS